MTPTSPTRNLVILGMHRSGTSMVAGALAGAGIHVGNTDELLPAGVDNPRGFFERLDAVALNEALLDASGASWFDPVEVAAVGDAKLQHEQNAIIERLGRDGWLLKDPRMVFTLPAWLPIIDNPLLVYVYRGPEGVARSLERRNGLPLEHGFALWERYNRQALKLLADRDYIALSYEDFAQNPVAQTEQLFALLSQRGLHCGEASLSTAAVFDGALDHSAAKADDVEQLLTGSQRQLERVCKELVATQQLPNAIEPEDPLLSVRITSMARAFGHAVEAKQLAIDLAEKNTQMERTLAQLHATERSLKKVHAAEEAGRADRDKLLALHDDLIAEHAALAEVHRKDNDELDALRVLQQELSTKLDELQAKADYLFHQLDLTYQHLLDYADSGLGKLQHVMTRGYKLFTFKRGLSTAYEDVLADAQEHVVSYDRRVAPERSTRMSLLFDVLRYLKDNPAGSKRSFSLARLRRAIDVFIRADGEDLATWVNQRFPTRASKEARSAMPALGAEFDTLTLEFPPCDEPRVSIIIPVYNQYRMTLYCLRSVLEHSGDTGYEIILADDASTDLTATIEQRVSGITIDRAQENRGFVRNCNAGAKLARGQYLLFLNNDTGVTEAWLSHLVALLDLHEDVGVVGPKLLFGSGELQEAGGIIWDDASGWNYGRMDDEAKPEYNYVKQTDYVSGACLLIRHNLWRELQGFDERYVPAYYEDTDICFGARKAGYRVLYQPASRVYHFEGLSNGTDLNSGIKQYQVDNQAKFFDKWQSELSRDHFGNAECVFQARDRSRHRRTILVIDHYVPSFDKDAGSRSTWLYLQLFVEMGYNVKFVGANFFPHQPYTEALQQLGIEVLVGEHIARHFDSWLARHAADIHTVYIHRPHVAEQFLSSVKKMEPQPKLVFFGHDLHYLRKQRELEISGDKSAEKESRDWRKREFKLFGEMDQVYYPSQVEVDEIASQVPNLPLRAIPLYVVDDEPPPVYLPASREGMLFVGGFNHPPNADGVQWFVEQVLPLVRASEPNLELHIVGSNIPREISRLEGAGVVVHGYLSDDELLELYGKVKMVVVPLRFGAGVKGKVVEAIQQGVPVVTTSIGAEGLPDAATVLYIADTPEQLAQDICVAAAFESACQDRLAAYPAYLEANFSKTRAAEIVRCDFGDPVLETK